MGCIRSYAFARTNNTCSCVNSTRYTCRIVSVQHFIWRLGHVDKGRDGAGRRGGVDAVLEDVEVDEAEEEEQEIEEETEDEVEGVEEADVEKEANVEEEADWEEQADVERGGPGERGGGEDYYKHVGVLSFPDSRSVLRSFDWHSI